MIMNLHSVFPEIIELTVSLLGVFIDLMHLMKPGGFDVSTFFCDIISPDTEGELGLQLEPCGKLEDLKKRVRAKEQKKRAMSRWGKTHTHLQILMDRKLIFVSSHPTYFRLNLSLGEGLNLAVGIYAMAVPAKIPGSVKLYRETNKQVHSKTQTFHTQTGSLLLPSEIKKAQVRAGWHRILQRCGTNSSSSIKQKNLCLFRCMVRSR